MKEQNNLQNIRDRVHSAMSSNGIGITELATKLGMTRQGLEYALKNKTLKISVVEDMANIFNLSVGYFFGESNEVPIPRVYIEDRIENLDHKVDHVEEEIQELRKEIKELKKREGVK